MRSAFLLAAALLLSQPALADYRSDYKAYLAALDAGDTSAAAEAGERAWRAAASELGDHKTTAVLAFNFANIVAAQDPPKAIEAYERVLALIERGVSDLSKNEVEIALLGSRYDLDRTAKSARALRGALERHQAAGEPATDRTVAGWRRVALRVLEERGGKMSLDNVDSYLGEAERLAPIDRRRLVEAQILAGMARIRGFRRSSQDIAEAVTLFDRAIAQFPPQADIDSFDRLLATALAWRGSVRSIVESAGEERGAITGSRIASGPDLKQAYERATAGFDPAAEPHLFAGSPANCDVEWADRKPPPYPKDANASGKIGTVLVGYDLNDIGVERALLLADFAGTGFGEAAIKSMDKWRLAKPVAPERRKNNLTFFYFVLP